MHFENLNCQVTDKKVQGNPTQ